MSDVTLDDLRVPRTDVPWSHLVGAQNHRSATVDDLISALGERVKPDYEAAKLAAFDMGEQIAMARSQGQRFSLTEVNDMKVRAAVDAAIGDKLLVDPTTEEER